jgi:DnaK suppressor protein
MNKKLENELKEKLEVQQKEISEQLSRFAKKDDNLKNDWDTKYPKRGGGATGSSALEEAADDVEEYANMLPVEHSLELRLRDIKIALEKIKKGTYGKCENCDKKIDEERLKIYPEARFCVKCDKK